jgi:RNA polymerase sigma factor (sigma-70 family)
LVEHGTEHPEFANDNHFNLTITRRQEMATKKSGGCTTLAALADSRPSDRENRRWRRRKRPVDRSRPPLTWEQQGLAARYLPLARSLAKRYKKKWPFGADEFESAACLALVEAAQSYDAAKNVKFATFARKRILGELRDVQREMVPVGWEDDVDEAPLFLPLSPDLEEYGRVLMTPPNPTQDDVDAFDCLESMIQRLPGQHSAACRTIYLRGLSQTQAAGVLRLSQARICMLHKQSMQMLNGSLTWPGRLEDLAGLSKADPSPGGASDLDESRRSGLPPLQDSSLDQKPLE